VNYEDRTDLSPPDEVVSRETLERLGRSLSNSRRLLEEARLPERQPVPKPIEGAIDTLVKRDAGLTGAPPEAARVSRAALLCGYRYARLCLGTTASLAPSRLLDAVDRMYVYDLVDFLCPSDPPAFSELVGSHVRDCAVPQGAEERYALEESAYLHWSLGVALAAAESSLTE
jgi:hypothetical protein